jgi:hypothetical protein
MGDAYFTLDALIEKRKDFDYLPVPHIREDVYNSLKGVYDQLSRWMVNFRHIAPVRIYWYPSSFFPNGAFSKAHFTGHLEEIDTNLSDAFNHAIDAFAH